MEQTENLKILSANNNYELIVSERAVFEDYENILNYLLKEMDLKDVDEIDDFDTHYQLFNYNQYLIVLCYSNYLGISIYFDDRSIDDEIQFEVLNEFLEVLKKYFLTK